MIRVQILCLFFCAWVMDPGLTQTPLPPSVKPSPNALPRLDSVPEFSGIALQAEQGDTLLVRPDGYRRAVTVRLIGVASPVRSTRDITGQEPWGAASQQWLALLVNQKKVRVQFDAVRTDGMRAYWGYLWLGDRLINEELLRAGEAILDIQVPNVLWIDRLRAAQTAARDKHAGVWDKDRPLPQTPAEFLAGHTTAKSAETKVSAALTIPVWQEGCAVGNKNSQIYRMPGSAAYEKAKVSKNAVFFAKEEDAQAAGFTAASR